ncbi:MAG: ABC transporter permease [Melioribacteraceae bacterium]|nr:ABC transporter permease [Melioribacteraceae bacterium]
MNNKNDKNVKLVLEVAKWEFGRWYKLKEQVVTLLIGALISLLIFGGKFLLEKLSGEEIKIVVINNSNLELNISKESRIKFYNAELNEIDTQKKLLADEKIDGMLIINDRDKVELTVNKEPYWLGTLKEVLNIARQQIKIEQSNISAEQLKDIFKQIEIKLNYIGAQKEKSSTGEKFAAGIFIALMLMGVFLGLAYQFVAITGEKQLRITEVIVSAISPQTWIDGKILGISFLSLAMLVTYSLTSVLFVFISSLFGSGWSLPLAITDPFLIIGLFLFSLAGFFFWNTFFSAVAATINDPNTSARGSLMMIPAIPVAIAFFAFGNPDSFTMKILSLFPLTSAPVISARMVLTDVSYIEMFASLLLLILSTWYLRKAAGKIFSLSVLMYGKEPSWKEISKWFRESKK